VLSSVRIKDFALIGDLTLEFGPHLNALTGETGAGKSIIVEAIGLLVGERAATGSIRSGSQSAYIEGIFTLEIEPGIAEALAEAGIELEGDTLIVSREVTPTRSVVRLNGRAVPLRTLQKITPGLIDIQGQSEQQSLSQPARQLHFVDAYGGLLEQAAELREKVREFRSLEREIAELREHSRNRAREIDLLRFQVEEIESAELEPDEEVSIRAERTILMNSRRLVELAGATARALSDEEGASTGAADLAGEALERLQEVADLDETVKPALERLGAATEMLGELASEMSSYAESVADDPSRLEEIELRLDLLESLKRKYGESIEAVVESGREAKERLSVLENADERAGDLEGNLEDIKGSLGGRAGELSAKRRAAADGLAKAVVTNLHELGMDEARFEVEFTTRADEDGVAVERLAERLRIEEAGIDQVAFVVTTNRGEELKSLVQVASGGEMSRIMLALKAALSEVDSTPTLIFDEVDQGIGARSAGVIGEKLGELARSHQVLCITHLPQVAAFADTHFYIEKAAMDERAVTSVVQLNAARRLEELAAMAGNGEGAAQTATELLERAEEWKRTGSRRRKQVAG
jgi:DNA repair protein RecN (Recombination protein N)